MKLKLLFLLFFTPSLVLAQSSSSGVLVISQSGGSVSFANTIKGTKLSVALGIAGNPTSPSQSTFVTSGCFSSGTCDVLDTYTGNTATTRTPTFTKTYDYFQVVASWQGGIQVAASVIFTVSSGGITPGPPATPRVPFNGVPTGSCSALQTAVDLTSGYDYSCGPTGSWLFIGPSNAVLPTGCSSGQVPAWNGTVWACSAAGSFPTGTGIAVVSGGVAWGTTLAAPTGAIVGTTDTQALTNKDLTGSGNTFPTLNQNTTGSAAKWTTARSLAGNSVDGSADVPFANKFIVQGTTDAGLSGAQFLGALGTGILKNTTTTGVLSIAVAADFPTLNQSTTGNAATATGINGNGTANQVWGMNSGGTAQGWQNQSGVTLGTSAQIPVMNSGATAYVPQTASQDCSISNTGVFTCTKTNNVAFGTLATLTPGTGVATFLTTPSSANLFSAVTGSTGSGGGLVFATSPALTTPNLGTPSAVTLTNATGLPLTGLSFTSTANTILGTTAAATSPSLLAMPSCSGATNALIWTTGTGIGCNTISTLANPMTTLGDVIYGGAAGAVTRLAGPTSVNSVPQFLESVPSAGAATAPVWSVSGAVPNPQTGTTYTFLATDRAGYTTFSNGSAIAVTLPQANSTGFATNYYTRACDIGAGTATITPTTSTISYTNGSAYTSGATSMPLTTGQCAIIFSDNTNYFANITPGGGAGTVTHTAGALTANQLVVGNGSADVKVDPSAETDGAGNLTALSGTFQHIRNTFYASRWCNTPGTLDYTCIGNASRQAATAGGGTVVIDPISAGTQTYAISQDLALAGCMISSWSLTTNVVAVTVKAAGSCHLIAGNLVVIANAAVGGTNSVNINNLAGANPGTWTIAASPAPVDPTGSATGSFSFALTASNDSSATAIGVVDTQQPVNWKVEKAVVLSISDTNGAGHSAICMTADSGIQFPEGIQVNGTSFQTASILANSANVDSFVTPCNGASGPEERWHIKDLYVAGDSGNSTIYQGVIWVNNGYTGTSISGTNNIVGFKGNTANQQPVREWYFSANNSVLNIGQMSASCSNNAGCMPAVVAGGQNFAFDVDGLDMEHPGQQSWSSATVTDTAGTVTVSGLTTPVFAWAGEQFIVSSCTGGTNINGTYNGASAVATVSTTSFTATALSGASGTGTGCTVLLTPPDMFFDGQGSNNSIGNNAVWHVGMAYFEGGAFGNTIGVQLHNGGHDLTFGAIGCGGGTGTTSVCLQREGSTTPLRISVQTLYAHSTNYGTCVKDLVNTSNSVTCGSSGAQGVSPWFSDGPSVFGGNVTIDGTTNISGLTASLPVLTDASKNLVSGQIPIADVGSAGLSGTSPMAISAAGAISITGAAGQVLAGATPAFTATPTLGASGTLGSLTFGNATSGLLTIQPVTGALGTVTASLPANTGTIAETNLAQTFSALQTFGTNISIGGVTATGATGTGNVVFGTSPTLVTPALGTPASGTLTNTTGYLENNLTGASAAGTITEGAATASVTRAGVATANLTSPWVFQNTNSTNNNTSITLGVTAPGTSTGQTVLNVNGASTGGDLTDWGTGGTWTAGVLSGQTIVASVLPTGGFVSKGTTAGFIDFPQGTTSLSVSPCNAATSICWQAPTAVTSYTQTLPAAAPNVISYAQTDTCGSSNCTMSFHPAPVVLQVSSNFTTAANTSLQTITGLSYTMPASKAVNAHFRCQLLWSQATATAAVAFGIQGATTAPTNLAASATSYSNTTAETTGTLTGLATTTATSIVSVAPSAITTIWKAEIDGSGEFPSNASPTVLNFMVSTATSGDAVTVYRDSSCELIFQ